MAKGYLGDPQDSLLTFEELRQFVIMLQGNLAAAQEKIARMQIEIAEAKRSIDQTRMHSGMLATVWE